MQRLPSTGGWLRVGSCGGEDCLGSPANDGLSAPVSFVDRFAPRLSSAGQSRYLRAWPEPFGFLRELGLEADGDCAPWHRPSIEQTLSFHAYHVNTKNTSMTSKHRPRGRPSKRTQDRPFQMRVSATFLRTVDDWRRGQIDVPSRAEAIRRMVELAAKMKKKPDYDREA